jgi:DNA invertase Pin-like site-specific DNA recombinase
MLTIAYCRVSTTEQTTDNQVHEIKAAGYDPTMVFADEGVSGSMQASARPEFRKLLETLEKANGGRQLIVTKLDRLGRDTIDILSTVRKLEDRGVGVVVLQLGKLDLTSAAGKMTLGVLSAVAEMERDLIRERTRAGLERAKAQGKKLGRRPKLNDNQRAEVVQRLSEGASVSSLARAYGVSRGTIINVRSAA